MMLNTTMQGRRKEQFEPTIANFFLQMLRLFKQLLILSCLCIEKKGCLWEESRISVKRQLGLARTINDDFFSKSKIRQLIVQHNMELLP